MGAADSANEYVLRGENLMTTSDVHSGLTPLTTYTYQVRGVNDVGPGAWSSPVSATTLALPKTELYDIEALPGANYAVGPPNSDSPYRATLQTDESDGYPIRATVKFQVSALQPSGLPLGASDEDVTVTVKVKPVPDTMVEDSLGLDSSGLNIGETLQGLLTIRGVDEGERNFSLDVGVYLRH